MLGFLFKVAAGTVKLGVKYIIVPAVVSVAITIAAEMLAEKIRENTPEAPVENGALHAATPRRVTARASRPAA
ncbi:MAG TPA: hypothetical protein VM286_10120 [Candidatus Thermoplasmatota archaeon]|nr:hypothetical protein [Candidatus Thermoplasmatota archaeon]